MAIQWGAWEYGGGNGMRLGVEVSRTSASHHSDSVTYTLKYYTQNQWRYNDYQFINFSGAISGSIQYNNNHGSNSWGGGAVLHATKRYTYDYASSSYGSSPATKTFTSSISGAYNGVTPSITVSEKIPARPYASPSSPGNFDTARVSDSTADLSWVSESTAPRLYEWLKLVRWDNIASTYSDVDDDIAATATTFRDSTLATNRRYRWALRAFNSAGASSWSYGSYLQTTPNAPYEATVEKSTQTSVIVRWKNGATDKNGYRYTTQIEQSINGGAWSQIGTSNSGTTSRLVEGLLPGSVYRYRVRAHSTVGATTLSTYATSDTIQLQSRPTEPSALGVTRVTDNEFTLGWTNNPNGTEAPYANLKLQRRKDGIKWENLGSLTPTTTAFTDTDTLVNSRYEWRIRAENAAGNSDWVQFTTYQTRPDAPIEVQAKVAPGGSIDVTWIDQTGYGPEGDHLFKVRHYKDGVVSTEETLSDTKYTLTGVDAASNYRFEVRVQSTVGYTAYSAWTTGPEFPASTIPHPPTNVRLEGGGTVFDGDLGGKLLWDHVPSEDGSDQTAFQPRVSTDGGTTWVELAKETTSNEYIVAAPGSLQNGQEALFAYRTWGVHATASGWSAPLLLTLSATPIITINSPGPTLVTSSLLVEWAYSDEEGTAQAEYELELLNANRVILEQHAGQDETDSIQMATVIQNGETYILRLRAWDGDGLSSGWQEMDLVADFVPPATPVLTADYSSDNGTAVLTLTPTPDDGGVTSLPAIGVDIQRQMLSQATGEWGPWTTLTAGINADTTLVDTTAGIAGDSQYRLIAHSIAPSAVTTEPQMPTGFDDRWVYLSAGTNFTRVCRLMGNVNVRTTTTRDRSLYHFAGRDLPVMYTGEARSRVIEVSGLLDGESSSPAEWEDLIGDGGVLLLRDPLGHRMYGSVPEVSIDRAGGDMYAIAFNVTEVHFP